MDIFTITNNSKITIKMDRTSTVILDFSCDSLEQIPACLTCLDYEIVSSKGYETVFKGFETIVNPITGLETLTLNINRFKSKKSNITKGAIHDMKCLFEISMSKYIAILFNDEEKNLLEPNVEVVVVRKKP